MPGARFEIVFKKSPLSFSFCFYFCLQDASRWHCHSYTSYFTLYALRFYTLHGLRNEGQLLSNG